MFDPPDLPDERIAATVLTEYGWRLADLAFLPLGRDIRAWAYRALTDEHVPLFLKLRQGPIREAVLRVPRYLADQGVPHIVPPLPARDGRLWVQVEAYTLTLYPFIEGQTGGLHGLSQAQWRTYGAALRALHTTPSSPDLERVVTRETFTSPWPALIGQIETAIQATAPDRNTRELATWWDGRGGAVRALVQRLQALGRRLQAESPPLVLCHADLHLNNMLIDTAGGLWVVDWDDTLLAPKEADLMMGIGGLSRATVGPREEGWFREGYGPTEVNVTALAYYRHLRAVGDIAANGEQIALLPGVSEFIRQRAIEGLERLFAPGYIVELARELNHIPA